MRTAGRGVRCEVWLATTVSLPGAPTDLKMSTVRSPFPPSGLSGCARNVGSFRERSAGPCARTKTAARPPCPGRVSEPVTQRENSKAMVSDLRSVVQLPGPRLFARSDARSAGTRERGARKPRRAQRTVVLRIVVTHDVKQRSVVRSRGALLRPGFGFPFASIPQGGVGGAPTGALSLLSRLRDATDPR